MATLPRRGGAKAVELPSENSLGRRNTPNTPGGVISFRADIGQDEAAAGYRRQAAQGKSLAADVEGIVDGHLKQKASSARSAFLSEKAEIDAEFRLDQDFETADARYQKRIAESKARHGQGLGGEYAAEYESQSNLDVARGVADQKVLNWGKRREWAVGDLEATMVKGRSAYMAGQTPADRAAALEASREAIVSAVQQGFISEKDGVELEREMSQDYAVAFFGTLPPDRLRQALGIPEDWSEGDKLPVLDVANAAADSRKGVLPAAYAVDEDVRAKIARDTIPLLHKRQGLDLYDQAVEKAGPGASYQKIEETIRAMSEDSNGRVKNVDVLDAAIDRHKDQWSVDEKVKAKQRTEIAAAETARIDKMDIPYGAKVREAKKNPDPVVQSAILRGLSGRQGIAESERRRVLRDAKANAVSLAQQGQFDQIPKETLAEMGGPMTTALQSLSDRKQRGASIVSDPALYNNLNRMSPEDLEKEDLLQASYLKGLSETDWRRFSDRQGSLARATDPATRTSMRTRTQIISDSLAGGGYSEEEEALFAQRLDDMISVWEDQNGKKAPSDVMQDFADTLLLERPVDPDAEFEVFSPSTWWRSDEQVFKTPKGQRVYFDTIADIPEDDLKEFKAGLARILKRAPTDKEVLAKWQQYMDRVTGHGR